ncbi:MAG: TerB family tellurite resistance protein [Rhodobacteraceae bacterium]|nr:TerB family tellurite resistance protein [Paracoccaceae bacterium]MCY4137479.1 TerB family tellurite resistance protein [Paracoccaceae bacterium]
MISELVALFRFPVPETPNRFSAEDEKLALAALMVRAARIDGEYLPHEQHVIDMVLQERFALAAPDSVRIRREAEELEAQAPDTVRFTRVIKRTVPYEERKAIVEVLWKVVLADDTREAEENGFLRLVTHLVGVADRDSGLARQRAERERNPEQSE